MLPDTTAGFAPHVLRAQSEARKAAEEARKALLEAEAEMEIERVRSVAEAQARAAAEAEKRCVHLQSLRFGSAPVKWPRMRTG